MFATNSIHEPYLVLTHSRPSSIVQHVFLSFWDAQGYTIPQKLDAAKNHTLALLEGTVKLPQLKDIALPPEAALHSRF